MRHKLLLIAVVTVAAVWSLNPAVFAQETNPTPSAAGRDAQMNRLIDELKKEKEIAELKRDIERAKKEERDAEPKAKATPLSSNTTISGDEIEGEIIVFDELKTLMSVISESILKKVPAGSTIAIYNADAVEDLRFYRQSFPMFRLVLQDLSANYCSLANSDDSKKDTPRLLGIAPALAQSANVVGQVADILAYLRTETKLTGKKVDITEASMIAALFGKLRESNNNLRLVYPANYPPEISLFCGTRTVRKPCCTPKPGETCEETIPVFCSETANLFNELYRARRIASESTDGGKGLARINKDFEDFNNLFVDKDGVTKKSAIQKYLDAEEMLEVLKQPNIYLLDIKAISAVGRQRVRKNLFFLSDKVDHSGGVIVEWTLYDKSASVVGSGVETSYSTYRKPTKIDRK